jgi:hypothetical protein
MQLFCADILGLCNFDGRKLIEKWYLNILVILTGVVDFTNILRVELWTQNRPCSLFLTIVFLKKICYY